MTHFNLKQSHLSSDTKHDLQNIIQWLSAGDDHDDTVNVLYRSTQNMPHEAKDNRIPAMLEYLDFDYEHFTVERYIQHIEGCLQRIVEPVPFDLSPATSGACVRKADRDLIFFNQNRHTILQEHIILHESAHLLFNHTLLKINLEEFGDNVSQTFKLGAHFRTYDVILAAAIAQYLPMNADQEAEAEAFARQFMSKIQNHKRRRDLSKTRNTRLFPPFN